MLPLSLLGPTFYELWKEFGKVKDHQRFSIQFKGRDKVAPQNKRVWFPEKKETVIKMLVFEEIFEKDMAMIKFFYLFKVWHNTSLQIHEWIPEISVHMNKLQNWRLSLNKGYLLKHTWRHFWSCFLTLRVNDMDPSDYSWSVDETREVHQWEPYCQERLTLEKSWVTTTAEIYRQVTYAVAKHMDFHEHICAAVKELAKISEKTILIFVLPYACASTLTLSTSPFLSSDFFFYCCWF